MSDQDQSIALVNRLYAEVAALQAELQIVKENYEACHSQYCAGRAVANALRAERDAMERRARAYEFGATKLQAEVERLREALNGLLYTIDGPAWRDSTGLRLSDVVPSVEAARAALEPKP